MKGKFLTLISYVCLYPTIEITDCFLSNQSVIPNFIFTNILDEISVFIDEDPNEIDCVKLVRNEMTLPVLIEYKQQIYPNFEQVLEKINILIASIRNEMETSLKLSTWLTDNSRQAALDKLAKIKFFVGLSRPEEPIWDEYLSSKQSKGYNLAGSDSIVNNILIIREHLSKFKLDEIRKPSQNIHWLNIDSGAKAINVELFDEVNAIDIPIVLLQAPIFDLQQPDYMNFGGIGIMIARTIIKAFDLRGSHYDPNGNLNNWWDAESETKYRDLAQTIFDQSLIDGDIKHAEKKIANILLDMGSFRIASGAFEASSNEKSLYSKLTNWNILNGMQLFWVSSAGNVASLTEDSEHYNSQMEMGRLDESLKHVAEFSDDFNCRNGTKCNPRDLKKVDIW